MLRRKKLMMPRKLKRRRPTMQRKLKRKRLMTLSTLSNLQLVHLLLLLPQHLPLELLQRPPQPPQLLVIMPRKKLSMLKRRKLTMPRKLKKRRHMMPSMLPNTEPHPLENPRPMTMTSISKLMKKDIRLDYPCILPNITLMDCLSLSITISRLCRTTPSTHTTKTITWLPITDYNKRMLTDDFYKSTLRNYMLLFSKS